MARQKQMALDPNAADRSPLERAVRCWQLYVLLIPAVVWLILFAYYPMYGLIIAFKDFKIRAGIMASPWVTPWYKHFADFFSTSIAKTTIVNTVLLSLFQLLFSFWVPVLFALLQIGRAHV